MASCLILTGGWGVVVCAVTSLLQREGWCTVRKWLSGCCVLGGCTLQRNVALLSSLTPDPACPFLSLLGVEDDTFDAKLSIVCA